MARLSVVAQRNPTGLYSLRTAFCARAHGTFRYEIEFLIFQMKRKINAPAGLG